MAPKKQTPAKDGKKAAPVKKAVKKDDDMDFLNAQVKTNAKATQELEQKNKEDKKKATEKKIAAEKIQREKDAEKAKAVAQLPAIYVDDVCKQLYERHGGEKQKDSFRDMCWLHFSLFNFFNMVIESKRKLIFRSAEHPKGEALATFECHDLTDDDDSPHSWLVFNTVSGKTYSVDLTMKQFEPKGKYGHSRDTNEALGCVAVEGPSRLLNKDKSAPHKGTVCKDGGVFPNSEGKTILVASAVPEAEPKKAEKKDEKATEKKGKKEEKEEEEKKVVIGVPEGTTKAYAKFLKAAQSGRHQDMSTSEARSARILFKNKVGRLLADAHEELEEYWFTKPLAAAAAAKDAKKEE